MEILGDFQTSVHKALEEISPNYKKYKGLVICGTHTPHGVEPIIEKIRIARETEIPFLGICFGAQLAAIEYARNVLGVKDATSEEFGKGTFVVKKRKELKVGFHDGENYWSNYEIAIIPNYPHWMICVPYHPEYNSSISKPHKDLIKFLQLCKK